MTDEEFKSSAPTLRGELVGVAMRYVDADSANDIAQDTLLRLWEMRQTLRSDFGAFAKVVAKNLAVDALRRCRPIVKLEMAAEVENPAAENHERYTRVMAIIDTLPPVQQTIIRLRLTEEMDYNEISRLTGMKQAAIRQCVCRARAEILKQYSKTKK